MSVMKYKDPTTGEVKKVGAPKIDTYTKTETDTLLQKKADLGADGKVPESQLPSMGYSKPETLSDTTKTMFGLDATAVPDDAFSILSKRGCAVLNVVVSEGTVVTATKGTKEWSATSGSSGYASIFLDEFGEWIIRATINETLVTKIFVVDSISVFYIVLDSLENTTWESIKIISESGFAPDYWNIGDTKTLMINGVNYIAQIIGFNHDTKTAGGKAGITFQLQNTLNTLYSMNNEDSNVGGWADTVMRNSTLTTVFSQLPTELKNAIVSVNKKSSIGNSSSTLQTTSDKLFLLSEIEVFGKVTYSYDGEGEQYEYYYAGNSTLKYNNGRVYDWFLRSPVVDGNNGFCIVNNNGLPLTGWAGRQTKGVSFAFCV